MSLNPHAGGTPVANPINNQTNALLASTKSKYGPAAMIALSAALSTLAASITISINRELEQITKMAANKIFLKKMGVTLPVKAPDASSAMKSINTILGGSPTVDTAKIQKAAQLTETAPDPSAMNTFTTKMADVNITQSQQKVDMMKSLADINGMKAAVDKLV
jgi:hypothetical protein